MRRFLFTLAFVLLAAPFAAAQTTTVTGTVKDANGNVYANGTVSANIAVNTGQPIPAGVPASGTLASTLNGQGFFSFAIPSPFTWVFSICGTPANLGPRGNPPLNPNITCFITTPIAISGASQDITVSLGTVALLGPGAPVVVVTTPFSATPTFTYVTGAQETSFSLQLTGNVASSAIAGNFIQGSDAQMVICQDGTGGRAFVFPPTFLNAPSVSSGASNCTAGTWVYCGINGAGAACPANSWQNTDQGPLGSLPTNTPGIPAYNGPLIVYASNYGVVAKGQRWSDASWGSGTSPTVTIAVMTGNGDAPFLSTMCTGGSGCTGTVNWKMFGTNGPATAPNATATAVLPVGTITSFNSSTSVGVTPGSAATACTSTAGSALCQFFAAPNDDTAALLAAANAAFLPTGTSTSQCGTLVLPQGHEWISGNISNNLWNCDVLTDSNGAGVGAVVEGCGMDCSVLVPVPSATYTTAASTSPFFFTTSTRGKGWHYRGFSIDGMGQVAALSPQPYAMLFLNQNSDAFDVGLFQWGSQFGILGAAGDAAEAVIDHCYIGAAGATNGIAAGNYTKITNSALFWNIGTSNLTSSGLHVTSLNNTFDNSSSTQNVLVSGGDFYSENDMILTVGNTGGIFFNVTGGTARLHHLLMKNPNATNTIGIKTAAATTVYLGSSQIALNTGTGTQALNIAGTLVNEGGNSISTVSANSVTGAIINNAIGESGTITCATSAATITFKGTYINAPFYTIQDRTTAGIVTQTSENNTSLVVGCPGASDVLNYVISPNNF